MISFLRGKFKKITCLPEFQAGIIFKMAAQVGKWEVVGKGNKKRANNDKKKDKTKINDAQKLDVASKYFIVLK